MIFISAKILYLGLNPPPNVIHYPVIRTEKIEGASLKEARSLWPQFSHVIFTSKTTVHYWFEETLDFDKTAIAIGDATAQKLREKGVFSLIAPFATQEGVVSLLEKEKISYLFFPHSKKARPFLLNYLKEKQIRFFSLGLYDTHFQKPGPLPNLLEIEEIVFTSPSTVEGFFHIFRDLPKEIKLTSIGPITKRALAERGYV